MPTPPDTSSILGKVLSAGMDAAKGAVVNATTDLAAAGKLSEGKGKIDKLLPDPNPPATILRLIDRGGIAPSLQSRITAIVSQPAVTKANETRLSSLRPLTKAPDTEIPKKALEAHKEAKKIALSGAELELKAQEGATGDHHIISAGSNIFSSSNATYLRADTSLISQAPLLSSSSTLSQETAQCRTALYELNTEVSSCRVGAHDQLIEATKTSTHFAETSIGRITNDMYADAKNSIRHTTTNMRSDTSIWDMRATASAALRSTGTIDLQSKKATIIASGAPTPPKAKDSNLPAPPPAFFGALLGGMATDMAGKVLTSVAGQALSGLGLKGLVGLETPQNSVIKLDNGNSDFSSAAFNSITGEKKDVIQRERVLVVGGQKISLTGAMNMDITSSSGQQLKGISGGVMTLVNRAFSLSSKGIVGDVIGLLVEKVLGCVSFPEIPALPEVSVPKTKNVDLAKILGLNCRGDSVTSTPESPSSPSDPNSPSGAVGGKYPRAKRDEKEKPIEGGGNQRMPLPSALKKADKKDFSELPPLFTPKEKGGGDKKKGAEEETQRKEAALSLAGHTPPGIFFEKYEPKKGGTKKKSGGSLTQTSSSSSSSSSSLEESLSDVLSSAFPSLLAPEISEALSILSGASSSTGASGDVLSVVEALRGQDVIPTEKAVVGGVEVGSAKIAGQSLILGVPLSDAINAPFAPPEGASKGEASILNFIAGLPPGLKDSAQSIYSIADTLKAEGKLAGISVSDGKLEVNEASLLSAALTKMGINIPEGVSVKVEGDEKSGYKMKLDGEALTDKYLESAKKAVGNIEAIGKVDKLLEKVGLGKPLNGLLDELVACADSWINLKGVLSLPDIDAIDVSLPGVGDFMKSLGVKDVASLTKVVGKISSGDLKGLSGIAMNALKKWVLCPRSSSSSTISSSPDAPSTLPNGETA